MQEIIAKARDAANRAEQIYVYHQINGHETDWKWEWAFRESRKKWLLAELKVQQLQRMH